MNDPLLAIKKSVFMLLVFWKKSNNPSGIITLTHEITMNERFDIYIFLIGIHSMQGWIASQEEGAQKD